MNASAILALMAASLISLAACAGPQDAKTNVQREATFAGQKVSLVDRQGRCTLMRPDSNPLVLDMQWPCQFSLNKQHELRIETFRQVPIMMVERSDPDPAPSNKCTTDLQAVRHFKGKLETAHVSRIAMCGPGQWDQKMFTAMFDW